jgi:putative aldouronate transport system permease protein
MPMYKSKLGRLFDLGNYAFLTLGMCVMLFPFLNILATSLAPLKQILLGRFILWPETIAWDAYIAIFNNTHFIRALGFTIWVTVLGTAINLGMTMLTAYPLSKKRIKGRQVILFLIVFTILFSGGMIPTYLVVRQVGLLNTVWSLVLPGAVSAFYLVIMKNFFQSIPEELEEAARIDGCRNIGVFLRIVLPLSMPSIAAFTLFYSVSHWNQFFAAVLYNTDSKLWPIQVYLRQMIIQGSTEDFKEALESSELQIIPATVKMAAIMVATLPILLVYPFLQKHFAKGVLLGSVKG